MVCLVCLDEHWSRVSLSQNGDGFGEWFLISYTGSDDSENGTQEFRT